MPPVPPTRRDVLAGSAAALAAAPALVASRVAAAPAPHAIVLNDASGLSATVVARHSVIADGGETALPTLRRLLNDSRRAGRPVVVGGARHSMGGQSLVPDGEAVTLADRSCRLDPAAGRYRVSAGTRWRDVTAALDPAGWSVAVMQSNNDFSVGGAISVNAHGWSVPRGPVGSTIRSLRLLLADGSLAECRPGDELFRLAVGGYGLVGIIVEAEFEMVPNVMLEPRQELTDAAGAGPTFLAAVARPGVRMAYGRLACSARDLLREAVVVSFAEVAHPSPLPPATGETLITFLSGTAVRAQRGSEAGKRARWYAETVLAPRVAPRRVTRNRVLNQSVSSLAGAGPLRTDILHEYFVPPDRLADFLAACRRRIPASGQDLLNVTLRYVDRDAVALLSFAPEPRIALVMLFSQARTEAAEAGMRGLTENLIEEALECGGSFYLPYRLHATRAQVRRAYPGLDEFLDRKRAWDPDGRFRNRMSDAYLA